MKPRNIQSMIQPETKICPGCNVPVAIGRFDGDKCVFCRIMENINKRRKRGIFGRILRSN